MILVSGNVRFMRGFPGEGSNDSGVIKFQKRGFSGLSNATSSAP